MCGHHNFKISRFYFVAAEESVEVRQCLLFITNIFRYLQDYNSHLNTT